MNSSPHMLIVVGAAPNSSAAALQREMVKDGGWRATWVHTGQHHDDALSAQFFESWACLRQTSSCLLNLLLVS